MTEPAPRRKLLASAEATSRRAVLSLGLGFVAWLAGTRLWVELLVALLPEQFADQRYWVFYLRDNGWLVTALPVCGWLVARFFQAHPAWFAVLGSSGGQLFNALTETARSGLEDWLPTGKDAALFGLAWAIGVVVTTVAAMAGLRSRDKSQARADARAAARKAELEAFTNSQLPPSDPPPGA